MRPTIKLRLDRVRSTLPKVGAAQTHEFLPFEGRLLRATVNREAGRRAILVQVELTDNYQGEQTADVPAGVKPSTDAAIDVPKPLRRALKQLKRANQRKARRCVAQIDSGSLTLATVPFTEQCRENQVIRIEDMNVKCTLKNDYVSGAGSNMGEKCRTQLEYDALLSDRQMNIIGRCEPS